MTNTPPRRTNILLIEDEAEHARAISEAIVEANPNAQVHAVGDGETVVAAVDQGQPIGQSEVYLSDVDLVILDLKLPGIHGQDVLQRLKTDDDASVIPVVVLTRSRDEADRRQAYDSHANSYLVKPESSKQLGALVAEAQRYWSAWNWPPANP